MSEREEDMEAALLAGLVKSKMKKIDSLMESMPDIPADRIDLNSFVRKVQNPSKSNQNNQTITNSNIPADVVEATVPMIQPQPAVSVETNEELKNDIKNILMSLEKININLTKLTGMFGKVFHSMTKNK